MCDSAHMRTLLISCLSLASTLLLAQQPPAGPVQPIEPPLAAPSQGTPTPIAPATSEAEKMAEPAVPSRELRYNDFRGDDVGLVLRTLARQAKIDLIVSERVAKEGGTVTMLIQNKTAFENIEIIVESKALIMDEWNDTYFVKTATEVAKESARRSLERITRELLSPLAQFKGKYYKRLVDEGVPPETASQMVTQEELTKRVLAGHSADAHRAPGSEPDSSGSWFSALGSKGEGWPTAGAIASAVLRTIPFVLLHVIFAVAVWCSALGVARRGEGESLTFFSPFFWALATLIGGVLVAALYWLIHHSNLRRTLAIQKQ
jgi:hypothetical protein